MSRPDIVGICSVVGATLAAIAFTVAWAWTSGFVSRFLRWLIERTGVFY